MFRKRRPFYGPLEDDAEFEPQPTSATPPPPPEPNVSEITARVAAPYPLYRKDGIVFFAITAGWRQHVRERMRFRTFDHLVIKDPDTQEVLADIERTNAVAYVTEVRENVSVCWTSAGSLKVGDEVAWRRETQ